MKLYTIGYKGKSARAFFTAILRAHPHRVIDIRLRPNSQFAGFAKARDLPYFLSQIGVAYMQADVLAPTAEMLDRYRDDGNWRRYEVEYLYLLQQRRAQVCDWAQLDNAVLLCSEAEPDRCHRRLAAEYLRQHYVDLEIVHL